MDISENFDSNDNLIASSSMRDASNTAGSGYDSLNRPVAQRDSRTGVSATAYLSTTADRVVKVTDAGGRFTTFTHDTRGRRTAVDAPDAGGHDNITYTSYYPTGQVKATWGDQTYPRYHVYDGQNRLIALHTYNTAPTGEPTGSGSSVTTWVYNTQRGWLDRKQYNDGKGTNYTYTDAGRLETRSWSRLNTSNLKLKTTYAYTAGRLTSVTYNDNGVTPDVNYTYDSLGRVLTANNTVSANSYAYNANLTQATETVTIVEGASSLLTRTITRHYDNLLRPAGMELKDGTTVDNAVSYGYDTAGRLQSLAPSYPLPGTPGGVGATPDFTYAYQPNSYGLVQSVTGPAHTVTNAWETDRDVLAVKTNADLSSTPVTVSAYDYTVNNIGQRESLATSGTAFNTDVRTLAWDYDALGQVIAEADSGATPDSRAFEFDAIGNRKKSADSLTLPTSDNYVVNALNQYTTVELASSQLAPSYDDDGNLTDDAGVNNRSSFAARTYIWDAENRLIEVKEGTATIAEYAYDYLGRRVRKTVTDGTNDEDIVFLYDGWNVIAEYDVTSTPALGTTYTWGMDLSGSMQGAGGVGGLLAVNDGTATYYPTYDGNGNVSEYLNASGADVEHNEYDAFGKLVKATGSKAGDFRYRFSTKPLDEEIGWYYYGYRYYDPLTGRWPSRDPIQEEGGYNLYGFVGNDGVNKIDILGLIDKWDVIRELLYYSSSLSDYTTIGKDGLNLPEAVDEMMRIASKITIVDGGSKPGQAGTYNGWNNTYTILNGDLSMNALFHELTHAKSDFENTRLIGAAEERPAYAVENFVSIVEDLKELENEIALSDRDSYEYLWARFWDNWGDHNKNHNAVYVNTLGWKRPAGYVKSRDINDAANLWNLTFSCKIIAAQLNEKLKSKGKSFCVSCKEEGADKSYIYSGIDIYFHFK